MVQHADIDHTGIPGVSSSGVPAGTSFPGSPASNDLFYRTDRDLLYFYDGTRWLTVNLYIQTIVTQLNAPTTDLVVGWIPVPYDAEMYLVELNTVSFLTATAIWEIELNRHDSADATVLVAEASTSGDAATTWIRHNIAINAVLDSSARVLKILANETTGTATINLTAGIRYRLIG